jgi:murein L,D-transpeptidase YafK
VGWNPSQSRAYIQTTKLPPPTEMLQALIISVVSAGLVASAPSPVAAPITPARPVTSAAVAPPVALADSIVIEKKAHKLTLFYLGRPMRSYLVALGANPVGDKLRAGDNRTPEGLFSIESRNPVSKYHLALRISYPDARHRARSQALGVEPGGDIMIHGLPNGLGAAGATHRVADWTNGCIALTDEEIEEIWNVVPIGTPVEIKP